MAALQQLLAALRQACGWQAHRVHLLGFSQVDFWPGVVGVAVLARLRPMVLKDPAHEAPLALVCLHMQGGTVALELARQQQAAGQPLGSCVAISAALLPEQLPLPAGGAGAKPGSGTPVLLTHGSKDNGALAAVGCLLRW